MKEGKLNSLLGRRVLIVIAVAGLLGLLLALYYFVYAPRQQNYYNKSAFRILKSISENFTQRKRGFDINNRSKLLTKRDIDTTINNQLPQERLKELIKTINQRIDTNSLPPHDNRDSLPGSSTADIMQPIVAIRNNLFESVILSKKTGNDSGLIIYKSGSLDLDQVIATNRILKDSMGFTFPEITDVNLEGIKYKLFLFPFRIDEQFYLLGGFIDNHSYQVDSNRFPLSYIFTIALLIAVILLSLPFLKIFLIGSYENISINDVRAIIAMIFITPFLFILFNWTFWISKAEGKKSDAALISLHEQVTRNFFLEIGECIRQLDYYDSLYADPVSYFEQLGPRLSKIYHNEKVNVKDLVFYPTNYKNIDVVFWMDTEGKEIQKWYFQNKKTLYLDKSERQYFKDISRNESYHIAGPDSTTFSIQPTLSLVSGEYTVNIVKHSKAGAIINGQVASAFIGLSSKMYSVYQPVVPKGMNFCLVNAGGDILYHSESSRSLQENIFSEVDNDQALKAAISNRDSLLINNIKLYDKDVKLMISPVSGLPYYLVTYIDKRNQYLFTRHIIAFAFLCESAVLLLVSLFVLFFYFANKRFSELFFSPHSLDWIKPCSQKKNYYIIIICYQVALILVMFMASRFVPDEQMLNYILNMSLLLPFFVVMGYYLFRTAENNAILYREMNNKCMSVIKVMESENANTGQLQEIKSETEKKLSFCYRNYFYTILKIIVPYIFIMFLFTVLKEDLQEKFMLHEDERLNNVLLFLKLYVPLFGFVISLLWHHLLATSVNYHKKLAASGQQEYAYLRYLLTGLLMSIILVSIVPVFGFLVYANKQESILQVKSNQMYLARKIQEHRKIVNEKVDGYKYSYGKRPLISDDDNYINKLKFDKNFGLYLGNTVLKVADSSLKNNDSCKEFLNYNFYKAITGYLFMPADHNEYFINTKDYCWKLEKTQTPDKTLLLNYSNASDDRDYRDTSSFILTSAFPGSLPVISSLNGYDKALQVMSIAVLIASLALLIYYASKRIFLIGYFELTPAKEQDLSSLNKIFNAVAVSDFDLVFWKTRNLDICVIINKENTYPIATRQYDECILKMQHLLAKPYEKLWNSCSLTEKSVLYDFALDGFTNYRNVNILYPLYSKGVVRKEDQHLVMMTASFRNFLIAKSGSTDIADMEKTVSEGGKWGNLSSILYVLFFAIIIFLFIVQEEISQRILAIVTSLGALIPILLKIFNTSGSKKAE